MVWWEQNTKDETHQLAMKINKIVTLIAFLSLLFLLTPHTRATTTPTLKSVTPDTVYVSKEKYIVNEFDNLPPDAQLSLSPGGPYIKNSLTIDHFKDMAVMGNLAFVVTGSNMLSSIDLSSPKETTIQARLTIDDELKNLAIAGQTAFVVGQKALYIVDLAEPLKPIMAGYLKITDTILDIHISQSHGFLLTNKDKLLVVDITDAAAPSLTGRYTLNKSAKKLVSNNQLLFLDA